MEDKSLGINYNKHINNDEIKQNNRQYSSKLFSFHEDNKKIKDYYILLQSLKGLNHDLKLLEDNPKNKIKLYKKINRHSNIYKSGNLSPTNKYSHIRVNSNISFENKKINKVKQLTEQKSSKKKNKLIKSQTKQLKNLKLIENQKKTILPKLISYTNTNNNTKLENIKDENFLINNTDIKSTNENSVRNELPLIKNNPNFKKINNRNVSSGKYRKINRDDYDNDDEEQLEKILTKDLDLIQQNNKIFLSKKNLISSKNSSNLYSNDNSEIFQPTKISQNNELLYSADTRRRNHNSSVRKLFKKNNLIDNTENFILKMRKKSKKIEKKIKRGMVAQNLLNWEMKSRIKLNQWKYGVAEVAKYFIDMQAYGKPEEDELVNRKTFYNHVEDVIKEIQESIKEKKIKIITEQHTEQKKEKEKNQENICYINGYNDVENVMNKKKEFSRELTQIKTRQKNERKTRDYINNLLFRSEFIAKRIQNSADSKFKSNNNSKNNKNNDEENKKENEDKDENKENTEEKEESSNDKEDDQQSNDKNNESENNK